MSGPWHQKQPVPCSFSRNIFCFQITIFKTSHKKLDGTSWATVKDTGESSPRATSPWESQHPKSAPPQMPTQPLTSRDPQLPEQATHWQCHQPDDIHLPCVQGQAGLFPEGRESRRPRSSSVSCGEGQRTFLETQRMDQKPREPRSRVASTGTSEPAWTAVEAVPEPDQAQRRIWETFNKPHSPEDIVLTNSSAQNGFNLTP